MKKAEVVAALQLWQAFEYLSPQTPPKPECLKGRCTWRIAPHSIEDTEMPWVDQKKRDDLDRLFKYPKRFMLYAGVIPGRELVESARKMLGAPNLDFSEQASPGDAASVVLPIDEHGYVAGQPFVSTVPWALASLASSTRTQSHFNFRGFFGLDGVQAQTVKSMHELLVKLQLVSPQVDGAEPETPQSLDEKRKQFRTVTAEDVRKLTALALQMLGWEPEVSHPWIIQTQRISLKGRKRLEDPLNSFYAEEVENVQRQYLNNSYGKALAQFLESEKHPNRINLDGDRQPVVSGVHPTMLPAAAWPSKYPLVTAQQFAVNAIHRDLAPSSGIFSINGPPGTGKTTMLKDIVASVVQSRAEALSQFENPDDAFEAKLEIENHSYPAWRLADSLRGFGIVVTSANNGAVENISKELPGIGSIDENLELDYFSEVADSIRLEQGTKRPENAANWGMVSAALGNAGNRNAFANAFWWADMKPADKASNEIHDPLRPISLQAWVNQNQALTPSWPEARKQYKQAKQQVQNLLDSAAQLADMLSQYTSETNHLQALSQQLPELEDDLKQLEKERNLAANNLNTAQTRNQSASQAYARLMKVIELQTESDAELASLVSHKDLKPSQTLGQLTQNYEHTKALEAADGAALAEHLLRRPGLFWLIFQRSAVRDWDARRKKLETHVDASHQNWLTADSSLRTATMWSAHMDELSRQAHATAAQLEEARLDVQTAALPPDMTVQQAHSYLSDAQHSLAQAQAFQEALQQQYHSKSDQVTWLHTELQTLESNVGHLKDALSKAGLIDSNRPAWHLMSQPRDDFHKASPYQDDELLFTARRQLFVASMNLHKAFLMNTWKKMKPTLAAFVSVLQGQLPAHSIKGGVMALWDAFFVAVPLVSTTFASFPRLFKGVGREELAWVLIDEAGQAAPQLAVGALWRAKRAVIVGDPIQLEPVVGIPEELVEPLTVYCGTSAMYVPPKASVQTLADQSNRFGTYHGSSDPDTKIWLGSPLVVHRRCLNPMFDISNAIAYENKMVYGTSGKPKKEPAPSHWIDVPNAGAMGHWIPAQGDVAMQHVMALTGGKLRDDDNKLRIYVITPFKMVAENMRSLLAQSFDPKDAWEMCGTVHTFQGKEADYVLFLLGGDPSKPGVISSFAGRKPNLVNVAVTRAKKRLYVIGERNYWCGSADVHGFYDQMARKLCDHVNGN
jgi:predicted  nucleic acid-binding Zn-ribbon protein